jgi:hypothetical protein
MASLLVLLNRAVSYFNHLVMNLLMLIAKGVMMRLCCMKILASVYALLADGLLLLKITILNAEDATIAAC